MGEDLIVWPSSREFFGRGVPTDICPVLWDFHARKGVQGEFTAVFFKRRSSGGIFGLATALDPGCYFWGIRILTPGAGDLVEEIINLLSPQENEALLGLYRLGRRS